MNARRKGWLLYFCKLLLHVFSIGGNFLRRNSATILFVANHRKDRRSNQSEDISEDNVYLANQMTVRCCSHVIRSY